ncbi:MAG: DUF1461 domain-containing protein, partial [Anaerolineae bacterium]|nr:DUF1461 domain-containing protein [Anaerolineae bacterium]
MRVLWRILIALAIPGILILSVARFVTLPWYVAWEYARPGFPPDRYGMSSVERLRLARTSIMFLNRPAGSVSLAELKFSDGSLAYNERELRHMDDVKAVYVLLTRIALLALAIAVIAGILLYRD